MSGGFPTRNDQQCPAAVDRIFDLIGSLRDRGLTIRLVEQNLPQSLEIADRGYVLESGRIVLSDQADALLHNDAVRSAYLGG